LSNQLNFTKLRFVKTRNAESLIRLNKAIIRPPRALPAAFACAIYGKIYLGEQ
jgi:hypothetical protein